MRFFGIWVMFRFCVVHFRSPFRIERYCSTVTGTLVFMVSVLVLYIVRARNLVSPRSPSCSPFCRWSSTKPDGPGSDGTRSVFLSLDHGALACVHLTMADRLVSQDPLRSCSFSPFRRCQQVSRSTYWITRRS